MKIDRSPQHIVMGRNGCVDVICPFCAIRTTNEYGRDAHSMHCGYCDSTWRVDDRGCPNTWAQK